ncbi:unnamed protein product, partial [Mesorhabditis spiculigera]
MSTPLETLMKMDGGDDGDSDKENKQIEFDDSSSPDSSESDRDEEASRSSTTSNTSKSLTTSSRKRRFGGGQAGAKKRSPVMRTTHCDCDIGDDTLPHFCRAFGRWIARVPITSQDAWMKLTPISLVIVYKARNYNGEIPEREFTIGVPKGCTRTNVPRISALSDGDAEQVADTPSEWFNNPANFEPYWKRVGKYYTQPCCDAFDGKHIYQLVPVSDGLAAVSRDATQTEMVDAKEEEKVQENVEEPAAMEEEKVHVKEEEKPEVVITPMEEVIEQRHEEQPEELEVAEVKTDVMLQPTLSNKMQTKTATVGINTITIDAEAKLKRQKTFAYLLNRARCAAVREQKAKARHTHLLAEIATKQAKLAALDKERADLKQEILLLETDEFDVEYESLENVWMSYASSFDLIGNEQLDVQPSIVVVDLTGDENDAVAPAKTGSTNTPVPKVEPQPQHMTPVSSRTPATTSSTMKRTFPLKRTARAFEAFVTPTSAVVKLTKGVRRERPGHDRFKTPIRCTCDFDKLLKEAGEICGGNISCIAVTTAQEFNNLDPNSPILVQCETRCSGARVLKLALPDKYDPLDPHRRPRVLPLSRNEFDTIRHTGIAWSRDMLPPIHRVPLFVNCEDPFSEWPVNNGANRHVYRVVFPG